MSCIFILIMLNWFGEFVIIIIDDYNNYKNSGSVFDKCLYMSYYYLVYMIEFF